MRQIPSLDGPLKASRRLWVGVEAHRVAREGACEGLNLHRTVPDFPAASFNLRLSEIFPGQVEDFGGSVWGGLQIDA